MPRLPDCGTVTPLDGADTREAALDAVREVNGRKALRSAQTPAEAAREVEAYLVVPEWGDGLTAVEVARETLLSTHGLDGAAHPFVWAVYAAGARRLGFPGPLPIPVIETSGPALA